MAIKSILTALRNYSLAHFPTLVLFIGLVMYWVELYVVRLNNGLTSWTSWWLLLFLLVLLVGSRTPVFIQLVKDQVRLFQSRKTIAKIGVISISILVLVYGAIGFYASLLPVHLIQETDALMYHLTIPRQHLILHDFGHLSWSVADLFLLPLDYALSPYALSTYFPNKLIQYIFFLSLLGCGFRIAYFFSKSAIHSCIVILALLSFHMIAIQVGTAMFDLVILYCFLAFLDSLMRRMFVLSAIEFSLFVWSKPLVPIQVSLIVIILIFIIVVGRRYKFNVIEMPKISWLEGKKFLIAFVVSSIVIATPHLVKSYSLTGSPFYPLFVVNGTHGSLSDNSIFQKAQDHMAIKDSYGYGRSIGSFVRHFWLVSVPNKGVNNAFDYPLGLIYLLTLVPFVIYVFDCIRSKKLPILSLLCLISWVLWWFGSQQTRFLLVPLSVMIILSIAFMPRPSKVFISLVILSLSIEVFSLVRAHKADWFKSPYELLREKDRKLIEASKLSANGVMVLDFPDAAYASMPVDVCSFNSIFVLPHNSINCPSLGLGKN